MSGSYNRKDHLYQKAKSEGYRSRAAYKLKELQQKYRFIQPGFSVLDLGCWPGGWLQVAGELVTPSGVAAGVDLQPLEDLAQLQNESPAIKFVAGDARDAPVQQQLFAFAGGKFDVVLSDMSPKLSGISEVDRSAAVGLAELALAISKKCLKTGGVLVIKVFKGNETEEFYRKLLQPAFEKTVRVELDATRKTSNEFYLFARNFKG